MRKLTTSTTVVYMCLYLNEDATFGNNISVKCHWVVLPPLFEIRIETVPINLPIHFSCISNFNRILIFLATFFKMTHVENSGKNVLFCFSFNFKNVPPFIFVDSECWIFVVFTISLKHYLDFVRFFQLQVLNILWSRWFDWQSKLRSLEPFQWIKSVFTFEISHQFRCIYAISFKKYSGSLIVKIPTQFHVRYNEMKSAPRCKFKNVKRKHLTWKYLRICRDFPTNSPHWFILHVCMYHTMCDYAPNRVV